MSRKDSLRGLWFCLDAYKDVNHLACCAQVDIAWCAHVVHVHNICTGCGSITRNETVYIVIQYVQIYMSMCADRFSVIDE